MQAMLSHSENQLQAGWAAWLAPAVLLKVQVLRIQNAAPPAVALRAAYKTVAGGHCGAQFGESCAPRGRQGEPRDEPLKRGVGDGPARRR